MATEQKEKKCGKFVISGEILHSKIRSLWEHAFPNQAAFMARYKTGKPIVGLIQQEEEENLQIMRYNEKGTKTGKTIPGDSKIDELCKILAGMQQPSGNNEEFVSPNLVISKRMQTIIDLKEHKRDLETALERMRSAPESAKELGKETTLYYTYHRKIEGVIGEITQ